MDKNTLTKATIFEDWEYTLPAENQTLIDKWLDNICASTKLTWIEAESLLAELFCLVSRPHEQPVRA